MSREQKSTRKRPAGQSTHPMLIGVFIGVLLGLCLALGVALYLNRAPKPFVHREGDSAKSETLPAKAAPKPEPAKPDQSTAATPAAGKPPEGKTRFDFYKILPGEEPVTGKVLTPAPGSGTTARVVYYLQAGAFQQAADADNLKARLALAGLEAQIQTATLPDNSIWHLVRLCPYSNAPD